MKHIIAVCATIFACGCANGGPDATWSVDASSDVDASVAQELVCGSDFCGNIVDKTTGATANCGSCPSYAECGDNGIANICGAACIPFTSLREDGGIYPVTQACDYYFGPAWWTGYASGGEQFPSACNYMNQLYCVEINNPQEPNKPCANTVCGSFWCCLYDITDGINPLLPGAVANNDGGSP